MHRLARRKVILSILILAILIGLAGCQLTREANSFGQALAGLPDRLMLALTNLLGSVKDVGKALTSQISSIARGLLGR